ELAGADLVPLQEAVPEQELPVLLRDRDGLQEDRRHVVISVRDLVVRLDLLALDDRDRRARGGLRLEPDRLVDGHRLPAGEDVLDALRRRVLTAQRKLLQVVSLER